MRLNIFYIFIGQFYFFSKLFIDIAHFSIFVDFGPIYILDTNILLLLQIFSRSLLLKFTVASNTFIFKRNVMGGHIYQAVPLCALGLED